MAHMSLVLVILGLAVQDGLAARIHHKMMSAIGKDSKDSNLQCELLCYKASPSKCKKTYVTAVKLFDMTVQKEVSEFCDEVCVPSSSAVCVDIDQFAEDNASIEEDAPAPNCFEDEEEEEERFEVALLEEREQTKLPTYCCLCNRLWSSTTRVTSFCRGKHCVQNSNSAGPEIGCEYCNNGNGGTLKVAPVDFEQFRKKHPDLGSKNNERCTLVYPQKFHCQGYPDGWKNWPYCNEDPGATTETEKQAKMKKEAEAKNKQRQEVRTPMQRVRPTKKKMKKDAVCKKMKKKDGLAAQVQKVITPADVHIAGEDDATPTQLQEAQNVVVEAVRGCQKMNTPSTRDQCCLKHCFAEMMKTFGSSVKAKCIKICVKAPGL